MTVITLPVMMRTSNGVDDHYNDMHIMITSEPRRDK